MADDIRPRYAVTAEQTNVAAGEKHHYQLTSFLKRDASATNMIDDGSVN